MAFSVRNVIFLLGAISTAAHSQTATGSISGSVRDPSTAAVVGAKVTLTNIANNESRSNVSNGLGYYSFPLLSPATLDAVTQLQAAGEDLVQRRPTRFAVVFQKPDERLAYGSHRAFGHDGAGGAFAAGDPGRGLAYAYLPRRFASPGGAQPAALDLVHLLAHCAGSLDHLG